MNLKAFVRTALEEIIGGIEDAQKSVAATGSRASISPQLTPTDYGEAAILDGGVCGKVNHVTFDVAVTVASDSDLKGKVEISIAPVALSLGKGKSAHTGSVSRIAFSVPVVYPAAPNSKPVSIRKKPPRPIIPQKSLTERTNEASGF